MIVLPTFNAGQFCDIPLELGYLDLTVWILQIKAPIGSSEKVVNTTRGSAAEAELKERAYAYAYPQK